MKSYKLMFDDLLPHQKSQVRALLAFAKGDPGAEISEVNILLKEFDQEQLRSILKTADSALDERPGSVLRTHEPSQAFREDFEALPPIAPRVRRDNLCNPDPDGEQ